MNTKGQGHAQVHKDNPMRSINGKKAYIQKLLQLQLAKQTDKTDKSDNK